MPLVSNDAVMRTVGEMFSSNRIPHAIIIEGADGTGKHTLARYISAGAVCSGDTVPCGTCKSCHLVSVGSHPDVSYTSPEDGKKNISVDYVRALRNEAYLKPNISERRVFIIDPADTMNAESQNAILKVLEEPPAGAVFILITESASSLLPTVRSRCVTLSLSPADENDAVKFISENGDYNAEEISKAVRSASGNIGKAIKLLSGDEDVNSDAATIVSLCEKRDAYGMLLAFRKYEKDRVGTAELLLAIKNVLSERLCEAVKGNYYGMGEKRISELITLCDGAREKLVMNINLSLLFTGFCAGASAI